MLVVGTKETFGKERSQVIVIDMLIAEPLVNRLMIFARRRALITGILLTGYSYFRVVHDKGT